MKYSFFIIILLISFLFISCSKNIEKNEIVGKWKRSDTGMFFEFLDNGMVIEYERLGVIPGNYTFEKNKLEMTFPNPGPDGIKRADIKGTVELENDILTISYDENGNKTNLKLERIKK